MAGKRISVNLHTPHATIKENRIETVTSEGWWAPMPMLAHATAAASGMATTAPKTGEAKTITAAKPKAVAVWPEGKEL